jgi:hypothetical protein
MEQNYNIANEYLRATEFSPIHRVLPKIGRNQICPIENKKFKLCCGKNGQVYCSKAKENLENFLKQRLEELNKNKTINS